MGTSSSRTDQGISCVLLVGLGLWLLLDILRVWLPSLITVFGQAAATPPHIIGLFAAGWFLSPLPVLVLRALLAGDGTAEGSGGPPPDLWFALLLGALRLGLQATDGGTLQLYVASAGVFAGLTWLATVVTRSRRALLPGFALGIALATVTHAALGTYAVVWRPELLGWLLTAAQVALFWWMLARTWRVSPVDGTRTADPVLCFLLLPALLLAGMLTAAPSRAEAAAEWPEGWAAVVVAAATAVAFVLAGAARTPARNPLVPSAVLVVAVAVAAFATAEVDGIPGVLPGYAVAAQAVGALALVACLAWADWPGAHGRPPRANRAGLGVFFGGLVTVAVLFGYYAGYDLGYRADFLLVAVAGLVAVTAVGHGWGKDRDTGSRVRRPLVYRWPGALAAVAVAGAAVLLLPSVTAPRAVVAMENGEQSLRVLAYNLRMGYGLDGTFELESVIRTIRNADPDVVLLSEVDRGWLLNGGQDELGLLARSLDMRAVFAPAADQVWGNAVLSRLPVTETVGHPLRAYGAPVGAQALSVVVEHGSGTEIEVIATHLQPPADGEEPSLQAADLADIVVERAEAGRPIVLGGDLNLTPDSDAWHELERAGLYDALFMVRPSPTFPADAPEEELDHILVTRGLERQQAAVLPTVYSDHLPVIAVVRPEGERRYGT